MNWSITAYGSGREQIEVLLLSEPMEGVLLGAVSSPLFREDIAIALDDRHDFDYDFACIGLMADGSKPRIYMIPELAEKLKEGKPEAKTILFHELGHYVHKDYLSPRSEEERGSLVEAGRVEERELAADDFAAKYLGRETVVEGLEQLRVRIQKTYGDDPDAEFYEIGTKEIDLRIVYQRNK